MCRNRRGVLYRAAVLGCLCLAWFAFAGIMLAQSPASGPSPAGNAQAAPADAAVLNAFAEKEIAALALNRFDELDAMADSARSSGARFPGGGWKLYTFYTTIQYPRRSDGAALTDTDWQDYIAHLKLWAESDPSSGAARIALASTYKRYAWRARGNGFANEVTEEGWRLFKERNSLALVQLQKAAQLSPQGPDWYDQMISLALTLEWDQDKIHALVERSMAVAPEYYYSYSAYATSLLPKWNGEKGESEKFLTEIADSIGGLRGDRVYYETTRDFLSNGNMDLLPNLNWSRIRRGFEAEEALYGSSTLKQNQMAHIAVHALDIVFAQDLLASIGDNWVESAWESKEHYEDCRNWALGSKVMRFLPKARGGLMPESIRDIDAAVDASLQNPEGAQYNWSSRSEFFRAYGEQSLACAKAHPEGGFDAYFKIGKAGNVLDMQIWPTTAFSECMMPYLRVATFSDPPHSGQWIRLEHRVPERWLAK